MHGILQIYPFFVRRMQPRYVTSMCDRPLLREPLDDDRANPSTGQGGLQVKIDPLGVKDPAAYIITFNFHIHNMELCEMINVI